MSNKRTEEVLRKLDELRNSLYRILYRYKINPSDNDQSHTEMIGIFENDFNDIKQTIDNITWDDKSVKRFNFLNAVLLVFPTIISVGLIIFTILQAPQKRKMIDNLNTISDYQNSIIKKQQDIIALQDSIVGFVEDSLSRRVYQQNLRILQQEIETLRVEKRALEMSSPRSRSVIIGE